MSCVHILGYCNFLKEESTLRTGKELFTASNAQSHQHRNQSCFISEGCLASPEPLNKYLLEEDLGGKRGLHLEKKTPAAREDRTRRRHVHLLREPGRRDESR